MHAVFIAYGKRSEVELMFRDMEAQKHLLRMWKGKKKQGIYIQGQVRILPFGLWEYVFPKEDMDKVLTTLGCAGNYSKILTSFKLGFVRNALKLKKIPEFDNNKKYLWIKDNVAIIPIGIKEDVNMTEKDGWEHEAI